MVIEQDDCLAATSLYDSLVLELLATLPTTNREWGALVANALSRRGQRNHIRGGQNEP